MKNIKIIVDISSYLIRKAVLSLIYENFSATEVILVNSKDKNNLTAIIQVQKPDIILLDNTDIVLNNFIFKDIYFVGIIVDKTTTINHDIFDEILSIEDSQSTLIHKLQSVFNKINQSKIKESKSDELSIREKEILKAIAQGLTNQEIAEKLFLSIHTITTHRKNITAKLGIKTISGLTLYALLNGLVNLEETKLK